MFELNGASIYVVSFILLSFLFYFLKVMVSLHTENVQQAFAYALPTNIPVSSHTDAYSSTDEELIDSSVFVSQQVWSY